jgi:hypothetical protein
MAVPYWCALDDGDGERRSRRPLPSRQGAASTSRMLPYSDPQECWGSEGAVRAPANCSRHADSRRSQRNLRLDQLGYVLRYGAQVSRTGATFHILRHCDIAPEDLCRDEIAKLEGTVVLIEGVTIITVYRNRRSYHQIHKKAKYTRRQPRWEDAWQGDGTRIVDVPRPNEPAAA